MGTFFLISLAVCLAIAVLTDLLKQRIPNWLVFSLILLGFSGNVITGQFYGAWTATAGLLTGLLCFLPFHVFGAMGAGDVKLLAAIGTVVGPNTVFITALLTIVAGGFIALVYIALRGGIIDMLRRYGAMLVHLLHLQPIYIPPAPGEAAGLRFPYALAIACGTALAII